jgi:hypothetical protein
VAVVHQGTFGVASVAQVQLSVPAHAAVLSKGRAV